MRSQRLPKVLKWLMIVGLLAILSVVGLLRWKNNKANLLNRLVIFLSPYRSLSPYIIAQARLESANFRSPIYLDLNNCFGMTTPKYREHLGEPSDRFEFGNDEPLLKFRNDTQCFRDYLLWLKFNTFPKKVENVDEFVHELKVRRYFTLPESDYLFRLKMWL